MSTLSRATKFVLASTLLYLGTSSELNASPSSSLHPNLPLNLRPFKIVPLDSSVSRPISWNGRCSDGLEFLCSCFATDKLRVPGDRPRMWPPCAGHLTIRFTTLASLARSSSSPTMTIFVSNFFCKLLHSHSSSDLRRKIRNRSCVYQRFDVSLSMPEHAWRCSALLKTQVLRCPRHIRLPVMGCCRGPIHRLYELHTSMFISSRSVLSSSHTSTLVEHACTLGLHH